MMEQKDLQKLVRLKEQADDLEQKAKIKAAMDFQRERILESKKMLNKGGFLNTLFGGNKKSKGNGVKLVVSDGFDLKDYVKPASNPKPLLASEAFGDAKKKGKKVNQEKQKADDVGDDFFDRMDKELNNNMGGLL